jgi:hypothetical protein
MSRTIAALYDDLATARRAVHALEAAGVPISAISILAPHSGAPEDEVLEADELLLEESELDDEEGHQTPAAVGAEAGAAVGGVAGGAAALLAALGALAIPGLGPIVAAGPLVAALTGLGVGAAGGGMLGGLIGLGVPDRDAHLYAEGVKRGGVLVSAAVTETQAAGVEAVMREHGAHDLTRREADYRAGGWSGFVEATASELAAERAAEDPAGMPSGLGQAAAAFREADQRKRWEQGTAPSARGKTDPVR